MKVVILAGGLGTRLAEETEVRPKPMVEIGGRPILWHIMNHYAAFGHKEFYLLLGYKGELIKRFFLDLRELEGSFTLDLVGGTLTRYATPSEDWRVHLLDTGHDTNTGGRVGRLRDLIREPFLLTYGDGVSNVDLDRLLAFHREHKALVTLSAVRPPARFGGLALNGARVETFEEKPQVGEGWINGGFMVVDPAIFPYLDRDDKNLERDALEPLSKAGKLAAYRHEGFWQCMDTLRDKRYLEALWQSGDVPWRLNIPT